MVLHHYLVFEHFGAVYYPFDQVRRPPAPTAAMASAPSHTRHANAARFQTQVVSYFTLCVWLIPFALFISLSANENTLPTTLEQGTAGRSGLHVLPRGLRCVAFIHTPPHHTTFLSRSARTATQGAGKAAVRPSRCAQLQVPPPVSIPRLPPPPPPPLSAAGMLKFIKAKADEALPTRDHQF